MVHFNKALFLGLLAFLIFSCQQQSVDSPSAAVDFRPEKPRAITGEQGALGSIGNIVIANRASGTISVIDVAEDVVSGTYALPDNGEPMYVVWSPRNQAVLVGDRANGRIVYFDSKDFGVKGYVEAGEGVFHMWAQPNSNILWVVNDIEKSVSVIDIAAMEELHTIPLPEDLAQAGGKPHDVITGPFGRLAYVSVLGLPGNNDLVLQYDMRSYNEIGRAAVGKDPHLSLHPRVNNKLFVPAQNSNSLHVLNRLTMQSEAELSVPGAHGAGMAWNGKTFYTTNLSGGGTNGLFAIDTRTNSLLGSSDTHSENLVPVPHNIALNGTSSKLYVTHSGGTSNTVSVYRVNPETRLPEFLTEVEVGFNPFGLAFSASEAR